MGSRLLLPLFLLVVPASLLSASPAPIDREALSREVAELAAVVRSGHRLEAKCMVDALLEKLPDAPMGRRLKVAGWLGNVCDRLGDPGRAFRARSLPWASWWDLFGASRARPISRAVELLRLGRPDEAQAVLARVTNPELAGRVRLIQGALALMAPDGNRARRWLAPSDHLPESGEIEQLRALLDPIRAAHPTWVGRLETAWVERFPGAPVLLPLLMDQATSAELRSDLAPALEAHLSAFLLLPGVQRPERARRLGSLATSLLVSGAKPPSWIRERLARARAASPGLTGDLGALEVRCHLAEKNFSAAIEGWRQGLSGPDAEHFAPLEEMIGQRIAELPAGLERETATRARDAVIAAFDDVYRITVACDGATMMLVGPKPSISEEIRSGSPVGHYAGRIADILAVYPPSLLRRSGLKRIEMVRDYMVLGKHVGGTATYWEDTITLDFQAVTAATFHHEMGHILDAATDGSVVEDPAWMALNPKDFAYGPDYYSPDYVEIPGPEPLDSGFSIPYARSTLAEDKATLFEALMSRAPHLDERLALDPALAGKVALLKSEVETLDPRANESFWAGLPRLVPGAGNVEQMAANPRVSDEAPLAPQESRAVGPASPGP